MDNNINYSFVIPHHNTPYLLQRLINTIPQRQDIEIIVVDDNSDADKKACVIREDVKIIYIEKEQSKGAGHARNVGIDAATGKWLMFADADDLYMPNFLDVLDDYKDDDIDTLFFNINSVDGDTLKEGRINRASYHPRMIRNYDGSQKASDELIFLGFGPWRKMLNADYVRKYGFRFEEIPKDNDHLFALETGYFSRKWKVDERIVYTLTYTKGSITYSELTKPKCIAHFNVLRRRAKLYSYMGHPEWNWKCARGRLFQSCLAFCYRKMKANKRSGVKYLFYYLSNFWAIEKGSNYYIEMIETIKKRVDNNYDRSNA